mgnify:CR=1 FL=1
MGILDRIFGKPKYKSEKSKIEAVPGALVASYEGETIYNMLTPHMQQFLGRCVGAIKKEGIKAKGTGQFSILIGEDGREIFLKDYYKPVEDPLLISLVVEEAKK